MIAKGIAYFDLFFGLAVLLLPVLITELSRPRDQFWGAVIIFLGLILMVNKDIMSRSLIFGALLATLLLSRLAWEVFQNRLLQLGHEEKLRLGSFERWKTSFKQLTASFAYMVGIIGEFFKIINIKGKPKKIQKKWVRPSSNPEENSSLNLIGAQSSQEDLAISESNPGQLNNTSLEERTSKDS